MRRTLLLTCLLGPVACDVAKQPAPQDADPTEADSGKKPAERPARVEAGGTIKVSVDATGYHPALIHAPANAKITLSFERVSDQGCGQELVIASLGIERDLPLNRAVPISITTPTTGEVGFACGMDMYRGKVVVD